MNVNRKLKEGLVSVIIPVYNVSEYLSRCLDSIINQSYKNLEIIIVDDGSTDNSYKICKKYLVHIQNSVFEGELLESQLIKLKSELNRYIRDDKDSVIVFKSRNQRWMEKMFFGKIENDKTDNFL